MKAIARSPLFGSPLLVLRFGIVVFGLFLLCCKTDGAESKLRVTTTVTMVTDLVKQIGGDRVEVQGLMGPGVDPHLYKATTSDLTKLRTAQIVFYSGLYLEGKMQDVLEKMASAKKPVIAVTDALPKSKLLASTDGSKHPDPHVWFDVELWSQCVDAVVKGLASVSPANSNYFSTRGSAYKQQLGALHAWARSKASELPPERRILATSHDAFNYFGRAYDFKVVGLQGISTVTEASLSDVVKMVEFIKQNQVKAVFVESSVPHKTLERVSQDAGVKIGGELFSDAIGTPGQMENGYDLGTYEGMIKHNLTTIVEALR